MKRDYIYIALIGITALFFILIKPEKIRIVKETVEVEKEIEKVVERVVEVEKIKTVHIKTNERIETRPDGTTVVERTTDEKSEETEKLLAAERQRYEASLRELRTKFEKETTNPKKLSFLVGFNTVRFSHDYIGTMSYKVMGPITVGVSITSSLSVYPQIGLTF